MFARKANLLRSIAAAAIGLLSIPLHVVAETYDLPPEPNAVVGAVRTIRAVHEDTLLDIGRREGVGYEEIVAANRGVDPWLPGEGTEIVIPARFVLPDAPRKGVVVSLAEHRLYYYPTPRAGETPKVVTYPISVGKMDWKTPLGLTRVINKRTRPAWYPPESVRKEHAAEGRPLPKVVPPGPDNPLGDYAMRLDIPGGAYLIHGTNRPAGVGMQVTHGCIRMYPEDIAEFFPMVAVNTPVLIVHQPYKMGWSDNELFIEIHSPLEGQDDPQLRSLTNITRLLVSATQDKTVAIDWARAEQAFSRATGIPESVILGTADERVVRGE